jgi:uncharacterized protein (TIGR01777 family)
LEGAVVKVVVAGGSGFIGRALVSSLAADGHDVLVISRRAGPGRTEWDGVARAVDGADAVVNLAGTSIGGPPWTPSRKRKILESRLEATNRLTAAIAEASVRPAVFVSASGIGFAGDSGDELVDETTAYGADFLAHVCEEWEAAALRVDVRCVIVRTALVIGREAQALKVLSLPFRLFVGGRTGSGRQWFPWVHLADVVRIYREAIDNEALSGPVHAVAPELLRQEGAAKTIAAVLHRPARVRTPAFALRLLLWEQADIVLHGQRAISPKLGGFTFHYRELRPALEDALG